MKNADLIAIEQQALKMRNAGNLAQAAKLFGELVQRQPDWEHGTGHYDLACCLEDLGQVDLARHHFLEALKYEPSSTIFLGGYASLLFLHGDGEEALEAHLQLMRAERATGLIAELEQTKRTIESLGERLNMSASEIQRRIVDALRQQ